MKTNLAVIFGGKSVEHEISVITALQAIRSLDFGKYNVIPVYLTKNNEFYTSEAMFAIESFRNITTLLANATRVHFERVGNEVLLTGKRSFFSTYKQSIHVIFPIVHGTNVEDGTLQGLLQLLDVPYCGCDVTSSALGMDKLATKAVLATHGIPVLTATDFYAHEWNAQQDSLVARIEAAHRYPVIVKPVNLGSSVGVYQAADRSALITAIDDAFAFCEHVMIENAVQNLKEINCSVLGDCTAAQASPCEEPIAADEILSYDDKYRSGGKNTKGMSSLKRRLPADISPELTERIRGLAVDTFRVLGCSGVSRIDFLTDSVSGEVYVNEINTIPGSLSFYLWEAAGMSYTELLDKIIELAFARHRRRSGINYSFDANILEGFTFGAKGAKGGKWSKA
ncbi:MAG: D-alanine--D-alanine ligase [Clostridia bacterium]|nr:D-alanine--D-alanine ligase [Clostridia bacterium]